MDCQALLDENRALKDEIQSLRARLEEPEELQRAISEGDLYALVMPVSEEELLVFTLNSADSAYRMLLETANEDMVIVDAEFKITYVGKRLLNKLGYGQEEVIGRSWLDFIDESSKAVAKQGMKQILKGIDESYELKLICENSSPYWALIGSKPLFDTNSKFKGVLGMLTDITERKQAEEALREAYEALQAQSEKLQAQSEEIKEQNEELRSQNEELHEAYETLRESEARFRRCWIIPRMSFIALHADRQV